MNGESTVEHVGFIYYSSPEAAFFFFVGNIPEYWHLMNIFPFKMIIMSVLIPAMLSLLKIFLKSCFKFAFKATDSFLQISPMVETSI